MIALATYLSTNLWIRGIYEFSLTLFIISIEDVRNSSFEISILNASSKLTIVLFYLAVVLLVVLMIRYFVKNRNSEKWPKGILELYYPLKPSVTGILTYNLLFLAKRIMLAANVTILAFLGANIQLMINLLIILVPLILTIVLVRFKSWVTLIIHYLSELLCFVCFGLMFLYSNQSSIDSKIPLPDTKDLDRIIIYTITGTVTGIFLLVLVESMFTLRRLIQKRRKNKYATNPKVKVKDQSEMKSDLDIDFGREESKIDGMKRQDSVISSNNLMRVDSGIERTPTYDDIIVNKVDVVKRKDSLSIPELMSQRKKSAAGMTNTSGFNKTGLREEEKE